MSDIPDFEWPRDEARCLKDVWDGKADPHVQRRVIAHIAEMICGVNRMSLVSGSPDLTAFNEGRRWVARQIQNAITLPLDKLVEEKHEPRPSRIPTATERHASTVAGKPINPRSRRAAVVNPST